MESRREQLELLARTGQLLLQYNESTGDIHRALASTAAALAVDQCDVAVSYSGIEVAVAGEAPVFKPVQELRFNTALQAQIHAVLDQVRRRELTPERAIQRLNSLEAETPRHSQAVAVGLLSIAGAVLARLLGADVGATIVVALSTGLGLVARQHLHHRHASILALPLAAALIAGILGGLAIRLDWTSTPGLALIVPCLMLVPGVHLINGLIDLVDNKLPMSIARLTLAAGILVASSLGLLLGIELTLPFMPELKQSFKNEDLNLIADMILAGLVTAGFASYYNAMWPQIGLAVVGGAIGHGLRFAALQGGWNLQAASFLGGFAVGLVAAWIARAYRIPVATIAFAGAVTMMPGLQLYSALRGAVQLAHLQTAAESEIISRTLAHGFQAIAVVGALALGLLIAIRTMQFFAPRN